MSEIIEQAIAAVETQGASEAVEATQENVTETESEPSEPPKVEEAPFPKKAINAISRRDKQIGKLRAEIEHLRNQQPKEEPKKSDAPDEAAYENYGDYLKAVAKHEARQEFANARQEENKTQLAAKEQEWATERMAVVEEQAKALVTSIPDYQQIHSEYSDVVESLPMEIQMAFLEAENAPLAFYTLAKEGKLESLASMSPARAAIEIGKAEDRGLASTKKPVTKAPQPIAPVKGSGSGSKSLDAMTPDDIRTWLRS